MLTHNVDDELSHIISMPLVAVVCIWILGQTQNRSVVFTDPVRILSMISVLVRRACAAFERPHIWWRDAIVRSMLKYADHIDAQCDVMSKMHIWCIGVVHKQ